MEFRLLGPMEVRREGNPVALGGVRERQILALLLLSANRVVSADRLIEDLWGDRAPEGALRALRVFVSRLRAALRAAGGAEILHTRSPGYLIEVAPEAVDVARFSDALAGARQATDAGDHAAAADELRAALALWCGAALADVGDAPGVAAQARRLAELRVSAQERRIEADLACGRHADLVAELDALTREHPLRERLWAARMLALYRCGRQAEALRTYGELRAVLAEELGLDPGVELARLEGAVLRHDPQLEWQATAAVPLAPTAPPPAEETRSAASGADRGRVARFARRSPYVGRVAERDRLRQLVDDAAGGHGALVVISGEAGVGKTRLAEELVGGVVERGVRCRIGHCYEGEGAPYLPFVEILEAALEAAPSPAVFRDSLGEHAPEIARLLPRLRRLFPDLPPPLDLPPEQERRHLFNSVRDVLARAAAPAPMVLVFEDLHWADEPTLLLLEHLAERVDDLPVLVVGTYRDDELESHPTLARTVGNLIRRQLLVRVPLRRLPTDEVAALLAGLSGRQPPQSLVKLIDGQTDGLPFFVEEVYRHLAEEGRLFDANGEFRAGVGGEVDVPETLRLILGRRLEHLSPGTRRVLECAAVAGRAFDAEHLAAIGGAASVDLVDALEEAEVARLILPASPDPSDARLMFAHELIRQTILSRLSRLRRQHLHLRAADALERAAGAAAPEHAARIAEHLSRCGTGVDPARMWGQLVLAGRHAMSTSGYEEALRHFEAAQDLRLGSSPEQRAELWTHVAVAQRSLARLDATCAAWVEAADAYETLGDTQAMARACAEGANDLAWNNRDGEGFELAQRGLAALDSSAPALRARLLAISAGVGAWSVASWEAVDGMIGEAIELARAHGDDHGLGEVFFHDASLSVAFSQPHRAADSARRAKDLLRTSNDVWTLGQSYLFDLWTAIELGDFERMLALACDVDELATRLGIPPSLWAVNWAQAVARIAIDGDLDGWETAAREACEFGVALNAAPMSLPWLGLARFARGHWEEALELVVEGAGYELTNRVHGMEVGPLLQVRAYLGDRDGALHILDRERRHLPLAGRPNGFGSWQLLGYAVEGLTMLGERDESAALYAVAAEFAASGVVLTELQGRLTQRVAGMAAAAAGLWEQAEEHFAAALRQAEQLPHRVEYAETRRFLAMMLRDRDAPGDLDRAQVVLAEATARYRELGMPRHVELAERLAHCGRPMRQT